MLGLKCDAGCGREARFAYLSSEGHPLTLCGVCLVTPEGWYDLDGGGDGIAVDDDGWMFESSDGEMVGGST